MQKKKKNATGVRLEISSRILNSISGLNNDYKSVIRELVDNSIDSAEHYYKQSKNSYKRNIEIKITFDGCSRNKFGITVWDNAKGIDNLKKVLENIGDSSKADDTASNGQFGVGIFSFTSFCDKMTISSRFNGKNIVETVSINAEDLNNNKKNVMLESDPGSKSGRNKSFTKVTLENFKNEVYNTINENELKEYLEKQFEQLLARKNFTIKIKTREGKDLTCKTFGYDKYKNHFKKDIKEIKILKSKKMKTYDTVNVADRPVKIRLWIADTPINRQPFLVIKGRRIKEISDIPNFRSYSKGEIWSNSYITGFVDVTDNIEAKLDRTEISLSNNPKHSKAVLSSIIDSEEEIKDFISKNRVSNSSSGFLKLEKAINEVVINHLNINPQKSATANSGITKGKQGKNNIAKAGKKNKCITAGSSKKSTFKIKFDLKKDLPKDKNGNEMKSNLNKRDIIIYVNHKDFQDKLDCARNSILKISSNLITYIAGEITLNYFQANEIENLEKGINMLTSINGSMQHLADKKLDEVLFCEK